MARLSAAVTALSPGIHRIGSQLGSRRLAQWLAVGSEGALLLDTGVAGTVDAHVAPALARLGVRPEDVVEVIDSHADVDHYGGNAEARALFPNARLRCHPLDRPLIESWERIAAERYGWYRAYGLDYPESVWEWLHEAAGPDRALDGTVAEGERIDLGGLVLEVLHLPGHSRGHLGLLDAASGTAIVSDAAMGAGFLNLADELVSPPPYVDLAAYRGTLERLRALAPARLATAHFDPFEGAEADAFLARGERIVEAIEDALRAALEPRPRTLPELLAAVAPTVGPYPEMEVELARSLGAHLEAAQAAGRVERTESGGLPAWRRR